jgi:spermidine/putrescine transport system permease protein
MPVIAALSRGRNLAGQPNDALARVRAVGSVLFNYGIPIALVLLPLCSFLCYSFFYVSDDQIVYQLTFRNYVRFVEDSIYLPLFWKTLLLALEVSLVTLLLGYPSAYLLAIIRGRAKYLLALIFTVPLFMSYIIKIYAIRSILGTDGLLNNALIQLGVIEEPTDIFLFNLTAVLITLSVILLPFATLPIFVSLEKIPKQLIEASADLGARRWYTFRRIILPLSLPGVAVGASFTFILAIGDYVTPEMVGGTTGFTYGRAISSQFGMAYNWPFGSALSVVLLVVVLAAILLPALLDRMRGAKA